MIITGSVVILGAIWFATRLPAIRKQIRPIYQAMGILPPVWNRWSRMPPDRMLLVQPTLKSHNRRTRLQDACGGLILLDVLAESLGHALLFVFYRRTLYTKSWRPVLFSPWYSSRHCCWLPPAPPWHSKRTPATQAMAEEERTSHALNRLTFGPRPGDFERVEAIGVKKWIELQLNPEQIDDSLLEARLQSFPAMHLSQQDLLQKFPSAAVIRAVADGKVPLPSDRVERAIYQNQVAAYEEKRQKQAQEAAQQRTSRCGRWLRTRQRQQGYGKRKCNGGCDGAGRRGQLPLHYGP